MRLILGLMYIVCAWRWGDWKHWKMYYPTILFFIIGNLIYQVLTYNQPMWLLKKSIIPTDTLISIYLAFVCYPAIVLMYIPHFPKQKFKICLYLLLWTAISGAIELIAVKFHLITYHNGWNYYWSLFFDLFMYLFLIIHYKNPLIAWLLTACFILFLWFHFGLTLNNLR
ncbi:hypothetical protein PU629_20340 [Pullulanibacillus sp. KACC 23026]|uniref:CBO0543 family protein n=1 Tax=Pullulanibacillus sp. KACC 23026 TaxID=3028315 RepID=UPI0023B05A9F|nr:CBO0543 family protein [Pullulanibacillus sp. KACC 23026]WEG12419.1 hypothetical protein PU629_20340 [Pullulanibacillus sp. KACC 23026]